MTNATVSPRFDRAVVTGAAGVACLLCWFLLASTHTPLGVGHGALRPHAAIGPGTIVVTVALWMTMMVAMMVPPVLPWMTVFASTRRDRDGRRPFAGTTVFVGGYFSVWAGYCLAATIAQLMLAVRMSGAGAAVETRAGGVLLVLAGLYQFSPLKAACLRHCRSPLGFLLSRWVDGPVGAWRLGATHGLYCLGCCWALMAVSFAVGVMNLVWMGALTVVLSIEAIAPRGPDIGRAFGAALVVWGGALLMT